MTDLLAMLQATGSGDRFFGVVTAVVTDGEDPQDLGRVRLHFPWLGEEGTAQTWWARVTVPAAGKGSGAYVIPDVGDHVLVAFEHGDVRYPYVLGSLWSSGRPPPPTGAEGNAVRLWRTPAGHEIRLDDTEDAERIQVADASGSVTVVLDTKAGTVTVTGARGIALTAEEGPVTVRGAGVTIESSKDVRVTADAAVQVEASGEAVLKGATVAIN
jgi:uncharacterized protein involved in type VI secretion and phage assembly